MTTTTEAPEVTERTEPLIFDANAFARGWGSAALAASSDKERIGFYRAVCVETYPAGVRLVATDASLLLTAWVPDSGAMWAGDPAPGLDEAPSLSAVALDPYGRAWGLLGHLLKLTSGEDAPNLECSLEIRTDDEDMTFDGMAPRRLILRAQGETVKLGCLDGPWPDWRAVIARFTPDTTDALGLSPAALGRVAKLAKFHAGRLLWRFGGADRLALIEIEGSMPPVSGAVAASPVDFDPPAEPTDEDLEDRLRDALSEDE